LKPGKVVGFVALTSQRHQGTRVGSSKRKKKVPVVDVVSSPNRCCLIEDIAACALITMLRLFHFDFWLATNRSFQDCADFQAHESKKQRQRASAASEAAR